MNDTPSVTETWSTFVRTVIGQRTNKEVAELIEFSESGVGNWVRGEGFAAPNAQHVVRFARTFRQPLHLALIAAGIGAPDDYGDIVTTPDASALTTDELLDELRRRTADDADSPPKENPRGRTGTTTRRRPRLFPNYVAPAEAPDL
jgi:hypothetical protein